METLKSKLQDLLTDFVLDYSLEERAHGGFKIRFFHILPSAYLVKLIAFCELYGCHYYITAGFDGDLYFHIYYSL